jgi:hypothetical protein
MMRSVPFVALSSVFWQQASAQKTAPVPDPIASPTWKPSFKPTVNLAKEDMNLWLSFLEIFAVFAVGPLVLGIVFNFFKQKSGYEGIPSSEGEVTLNPTVKSHGKYALIGLAGAWGYYLAPYFCNTLWEVFTDISVSANIHSAIFWGSGVFFTGIFILLFAIIHGGKDTLALFEDWIGKLENSREAERLINMTTTAPRRK